MKVLASLFRVIFSIIVLLAIACYLQVAPTCSLSQFCLSVNAPQLIELLSGFNAITVSLVVILLLGILSFTRVLEATWNVLFCASVLGLLAGGLYAIGGSALALPNALYHNDAVNQACQMLVSYEVPIAITTLVFLGGWVCASACGRVAITAVVSFGLWYGITEFFTFIVQQWANSSTPGMPEALHMIQGAPWIMAAVPGAFFLIYALLMAFFETFIGNATRNKTISAPEKNAGIPAEKKEEENKADSKPAEAAAKSQHVLKTTPAPQKKHVLNTPAKAEKPDEPMVKASVDEKKEEASGRMEDKPVSETEVKPETGEKPDDEAKAVAEKTTEPPAEKETKEAPVPKEDKA